MKLRMFSVKAGIATVAALCIATLPVSANAVAGVAVAFEAKGAVAGATNLHATTKNDLDQVVTSDEAMGSEPTVVTKGHIDVGPRLVDGTWMALARDDSGGTPVWRQLEHLSMHVTDAALMDAPTDEAYSFMGGQAGDRWWVVPQTENHNAVWLGWNTQDPAVTTTVNRGVTMKLGPVEGPGKSWLFIQDGTFGKPLLLMDGQKKEAQDVWVDVNTHVHANWVFTQPGVYLVPVTFHAETIDGGTATASSTLRFAVGDATDPQAALDAQAPAPTSAQGSQQSDAEQSNAHDHDHDHDQSGDVHVHVDGAKERESAFSSLTLGLGGGVLVALLAIGGFLFVRSRKVAADQAEAQRQVAAELGQQ